MQIPELISAFMRQYETEEQAYYYKLAEHVKDICEKFVESGALEANVTCRAKAVDRLQAKLLKRNRKRNYENESRIRDDIVDLSGVRIAVFFPHHMKRVNSFLVKEFEIEQTVSHPKQTEIMDTRSSKSTKEPNVEEGEGDDGFSINYTRRFTGYQATHFRARLGKKHGKREFLADDKFEIQVMTVFQSAWSELEHNLIYKQLKGQPSLPEYQVLDGLNGIVSMGDMYLEQLSTIYDSRIATEKDTKAPFDNKYELGSFLFSEMRKTINPDDFTMSSVDLLRKFLSLDCVKCNNKFALTTKLSQLNVRSNLDTVFRNPHGEKPNVSLVVLYRIYASSEEIRQKARLFAPRLDKVRCEVLLSTIISLDELFAPTSFWERELTNPERGSTATGQPGMLTSLKLLMKVQTFKNLLLGHKQPLKTQDSRMIQDLWKWFDYHPSNIVAFVFAISKLGVLRDFPQDLALLERISRMVDDYL